MNCDHPIPQSPACDSGVKAPDSLLDDDYAYGITACGFVVRALRGPYMRGQSSELRDKLNAHTRALHPAKYEQDRINEAMSRD